MRTSDITIDLPRFQKALETARDSLSVNTHWRYSRGMLPRRFIQLLVERPHLAQALADDIAALAEQKYRADR